MHQLYKLHLLDGNHGYWAFLSPDAITTVHVSLMLACALARIMIFVKYDTWVEATSVKLLLDGNGLYLSQCSFHAKPKDDTV